MTTGDPVLEADGVHVRRGERAVLDGVSVAVPPEARLLIRGASGAGKTTLFRVLGLLTTPDAGRVIVDGTDASDLPERRRARVRRETVGLVFQEFRLVPDLTAWENARLPQTHAGKTDEAWLRDLFDRLELTAQRNQYPATLSGGEKQRVAIARALANRPRVVLADEPTGQLDPTTSQRVLELLLDLQAGAGTALVVTSHDREIGARFQVTTRLENGRLTADEGDAGAADGEAVPPRADDG